MFGRAPPTRTLTPVPSCLTKGRLSSLTRHAMIAAPLRSACFSSLRSAMRPVPRAIPRVNMVRTFRSSSITNRVKTLYTLEHEWIKYDDETNEGVLGITDHAQNSLGDVVYLELPSVSLEVTRGDQIGSIESVKAASDIYSPVSGIVAEVNEKLNDEMSLVNKSPMEEGWLAKIRLTNPSEVEELLSEEAYKATLDS